jgi:hypothetical protein
MARVKTLLLHVLGGSFRAERHGSLVVTQELQKEPPEGVIPVVWTDLRELQQMVRRSTSRAERHEALLAFERLCRGVGVAVSKPPERRLIWAAASHPPMFYREWWAADPWRFERLGMTSLDELRERVWADWFTWDERHGQAWREHHAIDSSRDWLHHDPRTGMVNREHRPLPAGAKIVAPPWSELAERPRGLVAA